jgi:hypothetical protein
VSLLLQRLDIDKRVFFQGEGAGQTVLFFPRSLTEIYGNTYTGGVSQYAFGPGFINFNGADFPSSNTLLARVTARAGRRATVLAVDRLDNMQPGKVRTEQLHSPSMNKHGCHATIVCMCWTTMRQGCVVQCCQ